jgi:aspartate/methionine/tyrosine aminotransferase
MEVLAAANREAARGRDICHLEVGEPGGGPPAPVIAAARAALDAAPLGYSEALGLPALRERLARHHAERYGVTVGPERIALTVGASGGFILAFLAAFDPGARVAVAEPGYPAYRNILAALDIEVVPIPTTRETRFQPTPALLEGVAGRLDGLVIASPANPTGSMLRPAELAALARHCRARGIRLIADEIYHGITYEHPAATVLEVEPEAVVVNSFSKYFCMTGWRLGWLVLPEALAGAVERLAQNLFIAPPTIAQHAALGAFAATAELDARVATYRRSRDCLIGALHAAGLDDIAPADGAFYLYVDIARTGIASPALAARLLEETGIAVTPGVDFDPRRGERFIRLSFAGPELAVAAAADRLRAWLEMLL